MESKPRHIVIIGGGVIGCTTAYFLTRHAKYDPAIHKITIIEAAGIASSASGKAGGLLGLWANRAVETVPLSFRLHEDLAREHDGEKRWGYRKLQGCGTIDTRLKVDDLPFKERAAFPSPTVKKMGAKRQKLDATSSHIYPQTLDPPTRNPDCAPGRPGEPEQYVPSETSQECKPEESANTQTILPPERSLEVQLTPTGSPEQQENQTNHVALCTTSAEHTLPPPTQKSQSKGASHIVPKVVLSASSTGSSTRWKSHAILPNGGYYIGDWTIASNKKSDGHFPEHFSIAETGGIEDSPGHERSLINESVLATGRENTAISQSTSPVMKFQDNRESAGNFRQPKADEHQNALGCIKASALDDADARPQSDEPATYRGMATAPLENDKLEARSLVKCVNTSANKAAVPDEITTSARRSQRRRTQVAEPQATNLGTTNLVKTEAQAATTAVKEDSPRAPVKPRRKGGRKERAGKFPNSCVFPPDLTWINQDLVSSYKQQGAGNSNDTAQVHPYHFTNWMASLAVERGVRIRQGVLVTAIDHEHGKGVRGVEILERGSNLRATVGDDVTDVLVAAGSWTSTLLPKTEIGGVRAHSVVWEVDVTPHAIFTKINLPKGYVPSHRLGKGEVANRSKKVIPPDPEAYARPFKEVYACGAVDHEVDLPPTADLVTVDESHCDDIITWLGLVSPVLADAAVKQKQACYMPLREGGEEEPLFGRTMTPGLWLAAGHSCWGIQNAPACGLLMAEMLMDGRTSSVDEEAIAAYDPRRFGV